MNIDKSDGLTLSHRINSIFRIYGKHESSIEIMKNTVVRRGDAESIALLVNKTQKAYELAEGTGVFQVPKIVSYDLMEGYIEFERLRSIHPVRDVLSCSFRPYPGQWVELPLRIGKTLATIHNHLKLSPAYVIKLPHEWFLSNDGLAIVHGDFDVINVQYDDIDGHIVILDWELTPLLNSTGNKGPRFFDVAWFIISLFFCPRYFGFASGSRARAAADLFLQGYNEASTYRFDSIALTRYLWQAQRPFWNLYRNYIVWYKLPWYLMRLLRLRGYIKRFARV